MADLFHMLPDEERAFCDVLSRLCADRIAPLATETDETAGFVHRQLAVLAGAGMMGANQHVLSAQGLLRAVSAGSGR